MKCAKMSLACICADQSLSFISNFQAYPVGSQPRGLALIIDNERFDNNVLPFREGSMIDANNLDILFEQLGFRVR